MAHFSALNPHCADNHSKCNIDGTYTENNKYISKHDADHNHLWIKNPPAHLIICFFLGLNTMRAENWLGLSLHSDGWILEKRAPRVRFFIISSPTLTCEFKRKNKKQKQPLAAALQRREPSISQHMCSYLKSGRENLWTSTSHHNEYHRHSNQTQWAKKAQRGSEGRERKPQSLKRYLRQKRRYYFFQHTKRLKAE